MPDAWKAMAGNPGRRPLDLESGPQFEVGAPVRPDFLDEGACAEWDRIVPELERAGLLTKVDGAQLALYCQAYSRWRKAELKLQAAERSEDCGSGMIVRTPNGFESLSYWLVISNKAQEQLHRYLAEFGLSPSARAKVRAHAAQGDLFGNDPLGGFLRAAPSAA